MIKEFLSTQLRMNMASGVATTAINAVTMITAYPIYLHFLGYERYGIWLVLSTVLTFAQLGDLGIGQAVMKLVAEEYGRGNIEAIQRYVTTAIVILTATGIAIVIVIVAFRAQIVSAFRLGGENERAVLWLLPYIACLSVYVLIVHTLNAALSGLGRMDLANWAQSAGRIAAVTTSSSLLYCGQGVQSLLIGNVISYVLIHTVSVVLIRRIAHVRLLRMSNLSERCSKRLMTFGLGLFGGSLVHMLLSPFNKLMLSRYAGVSTVPLYEIAYGGSMQVRALAEAGMRALMPEVSRIGGNMTEKAKTRIREINRRAVGLIFRLALPLYGVLILAAPLLLRIWLGSKFVASLPLAVRIALIGSFLSLVCVPAYYLLLGLGRVRHCLLGHVILCGVSALLVLTFAWTDGHLSLPEVLVSILVGTGVSSGYIIFQHQRIMQLMSVDTPAFQKRAEDKRSVIPERPYPQGVQDA